MTATSSVGWTSAHLAAKHPIASTAICCCIAAASIFGTEDTRMVALTFDDGFASDVQLVAPFLEKQGMKATAFVNTSSISDENDVTYMSWNDLAVLKDKGWQIASHGVDHVYMTEQDQGKLDFQLRASKEILEDAGFTQNTFATPYGDFDGRVIDSINDYYKIHANAWSPEKGITTRHNVDPMNIHRQDITKLVSADYVCEKVQSLGDNSLYSMIFHRVVTDEEYNEIYASDDENIWVTPYSKFEDIIDCIKKSGVDTVTLEEGVWHLLEGKQELNRNTMDKPASLLEEK